MTQNAPTRSKKPTLLPSTDKEMRGTITGTRRPIARHKARAVTPEKRHELIAEAAWLIAERRGFQGDAALDDWLQAEAEIDAVLVGSD